VRRFYYSYHSRSEKHIKERLELIASSRPLCSDSVVINSSIMWVQMIVKQIRILNRAIKDYDLRISADLVASGQRLHRGDVKAAADLDPLITGGIWNTGNHLSSDNLCASLFSGSLERANLHTITI